MTFPSSSLGTSTGFRVRDDVARLSFGGGVSTLTFYNRLVVSFFLPIEHLNQLYLFVYPYLRLHP